MGRDCGDLAMYAAIACGAELVVTKNFPKTEDEIIEIIKNSINRCLI